MSKDKNLERRSISRVLISVSDKSGISELAKGLDKMGIELISTGGTSKSINDAGVNVVPVEEVTNFPEMIDGRVKTLHPNIFGGILSRDSDSEEVNKHQIKTIDMVICNLYPFMKAASDLSLIHI